MSSFESSGRRQSEREDYEERRDTPQAVVEGAPTSR